MFECIDQLGTKHRFENYPKRIISLVPSQTELLHYLGLENEVIGITKFCVHPNDWFRNKTRIGGTKNVNVEAVKVLQPDLIIANKEENVKAQIEALSSICPVWVSDVNNLDDALKMIEDIGFLTGTTEKVNSVSETIKKRFQQIKTSNLKLKTCYLIWREPFMTVGGDTFISNMLGYCGLENLFKNENRYPEITLQQLLLLNCELVLLSSEPYPFKQKHINEIQQALPNAKILLVDGEMFSWYGSRLLQAADYFEKFKSQTHSAIV